MTRSAALPLPYLDQEAVLATITWAESVAAIEDALLGGLDPAVALPRSIHDLAAGQLLLMPAESASNVGVKVSVVAPGNAAYDVPRVQALFLLMDATTLSPVALLDGTALTTLRTPSVSAAAVNHLAAPDASRLVVFGSGPQAWGHVEAIRAVRPIRSVTVVGRDRGRAEHLVARLRGLGLEASAGAPASVAEADIVACATTAREPLFHGSQLREGACAVAVGSHERDARELDDAVFARAARVVVEDPDVAMREAGDVILAVESGAVRRQDLVGIADAVRMTPPASGVSVFKSVGVGWQDLVVAQAIYDRWRVRAGEHG